jgi:hypothetical protein
MRASKIARNRIVVALMVFAALLGVGYGVAHASDKPPMTGTAAPISP